MERVFVDKVTIGEIKLQWLLLRFVLFGAVSQPQSRKVRRVYAEGFLSA
jgi:hypothetical protein